MIHIINELKRMKNKALAERVKKVLAFKKPVLEFSFFEHIVRIKLDIPDKFENKVVEVKMPRTLEDSNKMRDMLDKLHEEFDPRLEKVTEAYIGILESILTEASDQYTQVMKPFEETELNEESD